MLCKLKERVVCETMFVSMCACVCLLCGVSVCGVLEWVRGSVDCVGMYECVCVRVV